ncbi:SDR family oxidoreductase [Aquabacterium sp. J223]|uniref:SDR family oxidoreductase n=1 Tax=Aquabacterium sp. J223 TaxID=2898431 RepID=UPI0021ADA1C2|nr:SDR family oxidoreductase [Aquabacterium sp. J223]UUX97260.1 SDR family oxidoreductase [Aquabacterium sp. J223]
MRQFKDRVAVITGAASGFGLEASRLAAREGMRVVMADLQAEALERAAAEVRSLGAEVLPFALDVSQADRVQALAEATRARFGTPHFVFNNAGVGGVGGLAWEASLRDWQWTLGVNLMGVVHGVHTFTPMMLAAAEADPAYEGHIVNTASMAGLVSPPNMAVYNVTKHGVVALTETLYQDLSLVTDRVRCSVLCPFFVPTGIHQSERHRPAALAREAPPTRSQQVARAMAEKAVTHGKLTAADIARLTFEAVREDRFYIVSHPKALKGVQTRLEDIVQLRNPSDPFADRPEVGRQLRDALRGP